MLDLSTKSEESIARLTQVENMEVGCEVKKLGEHIDNLLYEASSTPQQKPVEEPASSMTKLKDGLVKAKEIVQDISKKLCKSDELNGKERCQLKEMKIALQTGQIVFEFEKHLAKYIYPHDKKFSSRKIFTNMKKWLEDKKDTEQGRKADEKWKALKDEFDWSSEHEEVFSTACLYDPS
jgi:hypothetical protein